MSGIAGLSFTVMDWMLFPVVDTEIGRIGTIVCMEGSYPETARGLAMNGAEIMYRPSYPEPYG